jgi:hypothetical protein
MAGALSEMGLLPQLAIRKPQILFYSNRRMLKAHVRMAGICPPVLFSSCIKTLRPTDINPVALVKLNQSSLLD